MSYRKFKGIDSQVSILDSTRFSNMGEDFIKITNVNTSRLGNRKNIEIAQPIRKEVIIEKKVKTEEENDSGVCKDSTCGNTDLDPILDPRYNLREIFKQLCLLQTHLEQQKQRCFDCIKKHTLTIEALIDEGIGLDKEGKYIKEFNDMRVKYKNITTPLLKKIDNKTIQDQDYLDASQNLRSIRKGLIGYASFC